MDYTDYFPAILAAFVSLVAVFFAYLLQLRALRRQAVYERKRLAYERVLNSVRRIKNAAAHGVAVLSSESALDKLLEAVVKEPEVDEEKARKVFSQVKALVRETILALGGRTGRRADIRQPPPVDASFGELLEMARTGVELLRDAGRANEDFEDALVSLELTGDRQRFAERLRGIRDKILPAAGSALEKTGNQEQADWSWFDRDLAAVASEMRMDLSRTLSPIRSAVV